MFFVFQLTKIFNVTVKLSLSSSFPFWYQFFAFYYCSLYSYRIRLYVQQQQNSCRSFRYYREQQIVKKNLSLSPLRKRNIETPIVIIIEIAIKKISKILIPKIKQRRLIKSKNFTGGNIEKSHIANTIFGEIYNWMKRNSVIFLSPLLSLFPL